MAGNERGPYFCLCDGCQRHEVYLYAMKRHVHDDHGVGLAEQQQGVDFGTEAEVSVVHAERQRRADVECRTFARAFTLIRGADDFLDECAT